MSELVALSVLALDVPPPLAGWEQELQRRGVAVVEDSLGRRAISHDDARGLITEHRENEARKARHRTAMERQAIEADRAFRESLPAGIPVDAVPAGITAAQLMMLSDPMDERPKRESVVEHALRHSGGAIVFHTIEGSAS